MGNQLMFEFPQPITEPMTDADLMHLLPGASAAHRAFIRQTIERHGKYPLPDLPAPGVPIEEQKVGRNQC